MSRKPKNQTQRNHKVKYRENAKCIVLSEIEDLIYAACRGGWPETLSIEDKEISLLIAEDYFRQIYEADMFTIDKTEKQCPIRMPDLKIVLTGTKYGYKRPDGVYVIPIGCLKD